MSDLIIPTTVIIIVITAFLLVKSHNLNKINYDFEREGYYNKF